MKPVVIHALEFFPFWFACGVIGHGLFVPTLFQSNPGAALDMYKKRSVAIALGSLTFGFLSLAMGVHAICTEGYAGFAVSQDILLRKADAIQTFTKKNGQWMTFIHWKRIWRMS